MDFINNNTNEFSNGTTTDDTASSGIDAVRGIDAVQLTGKVLFFIFTAIGLAIVQHQYHLVQCQAWLLHLKIQLFCCL